MEELAVALRERPLALADGPGVDNQVLGANGGCLANGNVQLGAVGDHLQQQAGATLDLGQLRRVDETEVKKARRM